MLTGSRVLQCSGHKYVAEQIQRPGLGNTSLPSLKVLIIVFGQKYSFLFDPLFQGEQIVRTSV